MIFGLFVNREKDPQGEYTRKVKEYLASCGGFWCAENGEDAEVAIVLGGDGTMLRAARQYARRGVPLLGINLGNVGYLTDCGKDAGLQAIKRVIAGNFVVQKRMMLAAGGETALNDAVVKGRRLTRFCIRVNGGLLAEARADGVVVATPTGSTAYSRSAGGPLLLPESEMMAITPVSPIDPAVRPWVVSGDCEIEITADCGMCAELDGEPLYFESPIEKITLRRAAVYAQIIKTGL
jgi:NAD+ kinase